jgi:N-methylhydantoinase A
MCDMNLTLGIDVGGTFTDFLLLDASGHVKIEKVPSSEAAPYASISEGLGLLQIGPECLAQVSYGTTIATNTLLERSGPRTGLITTEGFRDVIEMQRWHRQHLYDLHQKRPRTLVERRDRLTVPERVAADGTVLETVDRSAVVGVVEQLAAQEVASVAICLINAYANPSNEIEIKEMINSRLPDLPVSLSSDICPIIREYERTIVTVINAYTQVSVRAHLESLYDDLREAGFAGDFSVVQSNGGVISVDVAKAEPVRTVLSGPAGGVIGASYIGEQIDERDLITLDMGGTSCDVSLVRGGQPEVSKEEEIEWNVPISLPMISVKTIGAGGGSVAWVDAGDVLKVGPQSAGSAPGPACYGRGGVEPTVTDAQLLLGRLTEAGLLGGRLRLNSESASRAFEEMTARMELDLIRLAAGTVRIANQRMIEAIKLVTVDRGSDPRDFVLFAFGGAGPLHACEIARELGIGRVLIPASPGVLSALGLGVADIKTNHIASINAGFGTLSADLVVEQLEELERAAATVLERHGVAPELRAYAYSADVRYETQSYELSVTLERGLAGGLESVAEAFHAAHDRLYHYAMSDETPFLVNLEVTGIGTRPKPALETGEPTLTEAVQEGVREVYFLEAEGFLNTAVFDRRALSPGHRLQGPAIIDHFDTTTLVPPGASVAVDSMQNLTVELGGQDG